MNATIYIHKTNQAAWEAIENKSDFVNALLKEHRALSPLMKTTVTPIQVTPTPDGDSLEEQLAEKGFALVERDDIGNVKGRDRMGNVQWFDVKAGVVFFN
jgi:hypothetical protein